MQKINREILHIALPSIVSNITVPLLGLIDVAIVGHMGNSSYIGAVAVGSMCFNVIYWLLGFLRMGTSGMTAQVFGSQQVDEQFKQLVRSLSVALLLSLTIIFLQYPLVNGLLQLLSAEGAVKEWAHHYFLICVYGAPAVLGLYSMTGWYVGMQNTRVVMTISITQNIVNIVASLVFVYGLEMQITGVALGTLVAQWAGLSVAIGYYLRYYHQRMYHQTRLKNLFQREAVARLFKVNRDIFFRTLFLVAVNLFFLKAGAQSGTLILAANTMLMQYFNLFSYIVDGFAFAGEAVAGKYHGAKDVNGYRKTVRHLFLWGLTMALCYTLVYAIGGKNFMMLLTNDNAVLATAQDYLVWVVMIPLAGVSAFIWDGIFIGTTDTKGMLFSSMLSTIIFFTFYQWLMPYYHNHALWLCFNIYLFSRGIIQTIWYFRHNR